MKLTKIRIVNYKSIMDATLEIEKRAQSYTTILVGKNETGKSNLLDAIGFLSEPEKEYNYDTLKNAQNDKGDCVSFYYTYAFENASEWKEVLNKKINTNEDILSNIDISAIEKNVYLSKNSNKFKSKNNVIIKPISDNVLNKYYYRAVDNSYNYMYEIISEKELQKSENSALYKKLNAKVLNEILGYIYEELVEKNTPAVSKWMYKSEYLITKPVNLNEFKENNNICLPLKNIFKLADIKTKEEIKNMINSLSESPKNINKLEKILEHTTTEYILKVWPESNVIFKFKIQNDLQLSVYIFDSEDEVNSFYMSDRSEGFKQFISFILSISAENNNNTLKNNLILIDEPETHMHPSGIKYMKNELVNIGKNNYVFIATHSEFMIDAEVQERHYIVTKEKNNTLAVNWNKNMDMPNDEVLRRAFGLNLLCETLNQFNSSGDIVNSGILMDKALATLYPDLFVTSEKAKNIVDSAAGHTNFESAGMDNSLMGGFKNAIVYKFKELANCAKKVLPAK